MEGVTLAAPDTLLTSRAFDFLSSGPADARTLISHVCQLPTMPPNVAEHMAVALFAGHRRFVREPDGRWRITQENERAVARTPAPCDALQALTYAVVDVESTGSSIVGGDRITEVAVVQVKDGIPATVFDTLINPERSIPPYVSRLTNITWDMVKDAPTFRDVCDQLLGVLEGRVFVAHNAGFDWNFIGAEVERVMGRRLHGRRLCTVRLARKILPQLRRRSLDYVSLHYGVRNRARHRAAGDAFATAQVLVRMLRDARDHACETWSELERLLAMPSRKRRRRRPPAMPHSVSKDTTA
jgi:DNA polymerase-3 subunit epsilon